jgi:hypothetical protein
MANRYWVGGSGNWSDNINHWSASSGGSAGADVPTSSDDVFIDSNSGFSSGGNITLPEGYSQCNDFICTSGHSYTVDFTDAAIEIYGSLKLESGSNCIYAQFNFLSTNSESIDSAGIIIDVIYILNIGTFTLQSDLTLSNKIYINSGIFNANNFNIISNDVYIDANIGDNRENTTIYMGNGTWTINNGLFYIDNEYEELINIIPESSTIKFSGEEFMEFIGGSKVYNDIWVESSLYGVEISGSNTFNNFIVEKNNNVYFDDGTTTYINNLVAIGDKNNLIKFNNIYEESQFNIFKSSGLVSCDYLDISNSNAIGGAIFCAGANSINNINNNGWRFYSPNKVSNIITT